MIYRENPNFVAREIQPNPREVSYWIDLSESPQGQIIKTWVSGKWVKINPSDAEQGGVDLTEVKQAIANLQTNKADKQEVQEVKDQLNEIDLSDYITTTEADSKYQVKGNYALKTDIPETDDFITKDEADTAYQEKGYYLTSVPEEYITETELLAKGYATTSQIPDISTKQDKLVSGTNIKTINNQSVLGQGNIEITTGTGGITDAPSDGTIYGRQNGNWVEVNVDTSDLATKEELESKMDVEGGEFTGTVAVPTLALMHSSQGMMYQIQSAQRETTFRTMNAGQDTVNFMVQYSTPLKLTEAGIWENGMLLENKYALLGDIPTIPTNISTFTNDAGYITNSSLASYATQEYVNTQISNLVNSAPEALNTLDELAAALNDDSNFATTVTNQIATKLDITTYTNDKETFALKTELSSKADSSALANYLTTAAAESTYAKKSEIPQQSLLPYDFFGVIDNYSTGSYITINADSKYLSVYNVQSEIDSLDIRLTNGLYKGVEYLIIVISNNYTPDVRPVGYDGQKIQIIGDTDRFSMQANQILEISAIRTDSAVICRVSSSSDYTGNIPDGSFG